MKEHRGAVRRQGENSLLVLHFLITGHAFDWDRATVAGNKCEFAQAWNTTSACVNRSINFDPGSKAPWKHWKRRKRTPIPWYPSHQTSHCFTHFSPRPITNSFMSSHAQLLHYLILLYSTTICRLLYFFYYVGLAPTHNSTAFPNLTPFPPTLAKKSIKLSSRQLYTQLLFSATT